MSNILPADKADIIKNLRGVALGRTLQDLEKETGMSIESFIYLVQTDQDVALAFKTARELSAYVLEDEVTTKLRLNTDEPTGAVKTNALKVWADHINGAIKARNPMVYSGKADVGHVTHVHIETTLDLNAPKTIENIYDLTATVVEETEIKNVTDTQFGRLVDELRDEATSSDEAPQLAISDESRRIEEAAERIAAAFEGPEPTGRRHRVDKKQLSPDAGKQPASAAPLPAKKPRVRRQRARAQQISNEEAA